MRQALTVLGLVVGASTAAAQGAVITNGTVQLGVNASGALNYDPPSGPGVGLRDPISGFESTYPGCTCEGWGAGVVGGAFDGSSGWANTAEGGTFNLANILFSSTASTARSEVTVQSAAGADLMRVVHNYAPAPETPNLYQVDVSITNLTAGTLGAGTDGIRYRRYMDWDIPSPGYELVTLRGVGAANLIRSGNAGPGNTANPLQAFFASIVNTNFTDAAGDIGAAFDFAFPALAVGETRSFTTFYGVAPNVAAMRAALGAVGAEVYSLAYCEPTGPGCGPNGTPATFAFGFEGVGGSAVEPPPTSSVPEPSTYALMATGLAGVFGLARRRQQKA